MRKITINVLKVEDRRLTSFYTSNGSEVNLMEVETLLTINVLKVEDRCLTATKALFSA